MMNKKMLKYSRLLADMICMEKNNLIVRGLRMAYNATGASVEFLDGLLAATKAIENPHKKVRVDLNMITVEDVLCTLDTRGLVYTSMESGKWFDYKPNRFGDIDG